jgi:hypothetical protein
MMIRMDKKILESMDFPLSSQPFPPLAALCLAASPSSFVLLPEGIMRLTGTERLE